VSWRWQTLMDARPAPGRPAERERARGVPAGPRSTSGPRRLVRWGFALLLAAVTLGLSLREVRWQGLGAALSQTDLLLVFASLGIVLLTTVAKAIRWRILLQPCQVKVSLPRLVRILLIGQMGNSFLPMRLGDLGRAVLLGPQAAGGSTAVLGTIVVEKAFDGVMGLVVLVGLAVAVPLPTWIRQPMVALALVTGVLLLLLVVAARRGARGVWLFTPLTRWLPASWRARIEQLVPALTSGFSLLKSGPATALALTASAAIWGLAGLTNVTALGALGIDAPGWSVWLVLVTGYVATFLPAIPAHVGVFEYACVLALTSAGVSPEQALAFALVLHLLVYGPPAILGPISMGLEGLNWESVESAHQEPSARSRLGT